MSDRIEPGKTRARGIDRVLDILDYIHSRSEPLRISEIATGIGAPRSTVYEIVERLLAAQIVELIDRDGRIFLGRKLYFYGMNYHARFDLLGMAKEMLPTLCGEGIHASQLCMLDGDKYTVAAASGGKGLFRIHSDIGTRIPLPWTASGRLLVSHLSDDEIRGLVPEADLVLEDGGRLSVDEFIAQVHAARSRGHCVLARRGSGAITCLAVPVHDFHGRCLATLCMVVAESTASEEARYLQMLKAGAAELSSRMGFGEAAASRVA